MIIVKLTKAKYPHKYQVLIKTGGIIKKIRFGHQDYEDYTIHRNLDRKKRYLARHNKENHHDIFTAGFWAANLLWNKKTIKESARDIEKKYDLKLVLGNI